MIIISDDNECSVNNGGCNHICRNKAGSYECDCRTGYTLSSDGLTCTDQNECAARGGRGACDYQCINIEGTYKCACPAGYQLQQDGKTCVGELDKYVLLKPSDH